MTEQQKMSVSLEETAIQEFAARLRGSLLRPNHADYEQARRVYNGMIDKHPALLARCVNVADVIAAVTFAPRARVDVGCARRWTQRSWPGDVR